jgi:hypothetical protein
LISRWARSPGRFVGFRARSLITASVTRLCSPLGPRSPIRALTADRVRVAESGHVLPAPTPDPHPRSRPDGRKRRSTDDHLPVIALLTPLATPRSRPDGRSKRSTRDHSPVVTTRRSDWRHDGFGNTLSDSSGCTGSPIIRRPRGHDRGFGAFPCRFRPFSRRALDHGSRTASGGAARPSGQALACPRFCPEGSQRLACQGSRQRSRSDAKRP